MKTTCELQCMLLLFNQFNHSEHTFWPTCRLNNPKVDLHKFSTHIYITTYYFYKTKYRVGIKSHLPKVGNETNNLKSDLDAI